MLASYTYFDSSLTVLDHSGHRWLTSYISDTTQIVYFFCRLFNIFVSVSLLRAILLFGVAGVLKLISYFMSSLNLLVVFVIISSSEILRVILVRSPYIIHPMKSSSGPVDQVTYSSLMYSILSIDRCLSKTSNVPYTYKIKNSVPHSFTLYNKQVSVFHFLDLSLIFILLMYYLNQQRFACTRPQIYSISVNISLYIYCY